MRICTVIIGLVAIGLVSSCSHRGNLEAARVERVERVDSSPLISPISPTTVIQKPTAARASIHDKNYTAPYPKLTTTSTVTTRSVTTNVQPTNKALAGSTESFLSIKPATQTVTTATTTTTTDKGYNPAEHPVYEKAKALPPKEIEEGRYRTFRRVENDLAYDTRKIRGTVAEFIFPEMNDIVEKPQGKIQSQSYCYKSMGYPTCYSKPIPGQEFRLVGKPDPRF